MKEGILMTGFNNFIHLIQSQWTNIVVVIAIIATVVKTALSYSSMTEEQRVQSALKVVKEELMRLMCQAEIQWKDYKKSGDLKRSQVIKDIYNQFPFLSKYMDQDKLVKTIYEMIDKQMDNMDNLLNKPEDNK
jgi:hypothetical protein|nr:MAG TPA: hypothetical protein [Caudoviricetes sp.]